MSPECEKVGAFVDGQLSAEEAAAFREHLRTCEACTAEVRELMVLATVEQAHVRGKRPAAAAPEQPASASAQVISLAARRRRRILFSTIGAGLAAAAAIALYFKRDPGPELLAMAAERPIELRIAYGPADRWRPYGTTRAAGGAGEPVALERMAALERRGDLHGVGAGYLLSGDPRRAAERLKKAARSPDVDADRALAALLEGKREAALAQLDAVLGAAPRHPQATWNRAIVLRDLGLPLAAAEQLDAVAALGEAGWSDEARTRAAGLRAAEQQRAGAWDHADKSVVAWSTANAPLPDEVLRAYPSFTRHYFYHALRLARTRERISALAPIAGALDRDAGDHLLAGRVARALAGRATVPAELTARYADLIAQRATLDGAALRAFLDRAKRTGDDDFYLGAILATGAADARLDEVRRLVAQAHDPWFDAIAAGLAAEREANAGRPVDAETRLTRALADCKQGHADYRCVFLAYDLASLQRGLHRIAEARAVGGEGWRLAERVALYKASDFLFLLADVARMRNDQSMMNGYLAEGRLRDPSCEAQRSVHEMTAMARMVALDAPGARAALDRAPRCDQPVTLQRADLLAFLARAGLTRPDEVAQLPAELKKAGAALSPGDRLYAEVLAARLSAVQDPEAALKTLPAVLASAEARRDDVDAQRAAAYARLTLAVEAARAHHEGAALDWLAGKTRAPARCALAIAVDDQRSIAVSRGSSGEVVGAFDGARKSDALETATLVPANVRAALVACADVVVFAQPPLNGLAHLLSDTIAWGYRIGGPPSPAPGSTPRRLVVADVAVPERLGLQRLRPRLVEGPGVTTLTGTDATPARVLAEMESATEVEIHAHGWVDLAISDASLIALAPDRDGDFTLTAGQIRRHRLAGHPVVVLAACHAAEVAPFYHHAWSLPAALIEAGARAVFASPEQLPDAGAAAFFDGVLTRIRGGSSPATALRDERASWLAKGVSWVASVVLFD